MDYVGIIHATPKHMNQSKTANKVPVRLNFSGNFTPRCKDFHVSLPERRASMKHNILEAVEKRTEAFMEKDNVPVYEDPRDVIGTKPSKPPRKRNLPQPTTSPRANDARSLMREHKRKLTKKYEGLITTLMDKCEENVLVISEKESHIAKVKEKLRTVSEYNRLFSEENNQLKTQYESLVKYVEECKKVIKEERERNRELEDKHKELEEKMKKFEVPDRESSGGAIPLVEVCMSCSSRQMLLQRARQQNSRLQKDMAAMKDALYRLNVQLLRYQEKLRATIPSMVEGGADKLDSLTAGLGPRVQDAVDEVSSKTTADQSHATTLVDMSGLLSAQALAPLFDAFQENIQEKESLILDYEKQFENMNKKSKQIVEENKSLSERVGALEQELVQLRQSYKKIVVEKETIDIEKATLLERAERAESKLKEVYELYEDKMAAMMRDYETVHREYFAVKSALEASEGKMAAFDALRARTVPADLHERRLDHCKRLLEELKHQYTMENERKAEQIKKLEQQLKSTEEKYNKICQEHGVLKEELRTALKNVRLYRKAAVVFRQRVKSAAARATRVRRSARLSRGEPLKHALDTLDRIKNEIKQVKSRAHTSLEELERRIVEQEEMAARAQAQYKKELQRARAALQHKEEVIRSLVDASVKNEEARQSQTDAQKQYGTASGTERSPEEEAKVKLVPKSGGYYQDKDYSKKKGKS